MNITETALSGGSSGGSTSIRILSLQIAEFSVCVQQALAPRLKGRPVVIVTARQSLGRVVSASPEARECGIQAGTRYPLALRACPEATFLLPDPEREAEAEAALLKTLFRYTPALERYGAGRLFADTTGTDRLFGPALELADRLRGELTREFSLIPAIGVSRRTVWSDLAGRWAGAGGIFEVLPEQESGFLHLIPPGWVRGIGPRTQEILADMNILTLHQLTQFTTEELVAAFGRPGHLLAGILHPESPAERLPPLTSLAAFLPGCSTEVSATHTLRCESNGAATLKAVLIQLVRDCARQLRARHQVTGRINLSLTYSDGRTGSGGQSLSPASNRDSLLLAAVKRALTATWQRRVRLCRLSLRCLSLTAPRGEVCLFADPAEEAEEACLKALDLIRCRFGEDALITAAEMSEAE